MTVEEFISKKYIVRFHAQVKEKDEIEKIIESMLIKSGIDMKTSATDYVFPRILQLSGSNPVLLWDETFWELYYSYLVGLSMLCYEQKKGRINLNKNCSNSAHSKITYTFCYYLALVVKKHDIAEKFACYCNRYLHTNKVFHMGISLNSIQSFFEIAKIYVAVHEQKHFEFKHNREKMKQDLYTLGKKLDIAHRLVNSFDDEYCKDKYIMSKSDLLNIIETVLQDFQMQEELLCDTYAANHCIAVYLDIWKDKLVPKEIITKCLESIFTLLHFNSSLISLKKYWNDYFYSQDEVRNFDVTMIHRNYVSELIICMDLVRQNICDMSANISWELANVADSYIVEQIIYSIFISDEATLFWEEFKSITNRNEDNSVNIFTLLNWKI